MIRFITIACLALASSAAAIAAPCNGSVEKKMTFSDAKQQDTFVVEIFGPSCTPDARVLIYDKGQKGWDALMIGQVSDFGEAPKNPAELNELLKEIADRIEGPMMSSLESWAEIKKAATQPQGNPWRGTPLVQAEYERLYKAKPRFVYIPTDAVRAKLVVWDESGFGRPVDFVYYGD